MKNVPQSLERISGGSTSTQQHISIYQFLTFSNLSIHIVRTKPGGTEYGLNTNAGKYIFFHLAKIICPNICLYDPDKVLYTSAFCNSNSSFASARPSWSVFSNFLAFTLSASSSVLFFLVVVVVGPIVVKLCKGGARES